VISLRTADPTDEFELMGRVGYEFEGREQRGELVVSGPVSDTLKARLAGYYDWGDGYFINDAVATPGTGAVTPTNRREPQPRSYMVRGTILWNPSDRLSARFKANLVRDRMINAEGNQLRTCQDGLVSTGGIPFLVGDDCKVNRHIAVVYMNPANFPGIIHKGVPFTNNKQEYGTLELHYDLSDALTLDSTTGYYHLRSDNLVNSTGTKSAGAGFSGWGTFRRRDLTQEVRLNSDFASPLNFTLGALYQDGKLSRHSLNRGNSAYGPQIGAIRRDDITGFDIEAWSVFGQLRWKIVPQLELAGGARWSHEERSAFTFNFLTNAPIPLAKDKISTSNVSPELTLTYTPTDDITLFSSYKQAHKSGSFTIAAIPTANGDISFGDEKVEGVEVGLKARLLDRQVFINLAGYDYRYHGLQVGAVDTVTSTGQPSTRTLNAGSARTYGIDFDVNFRPRAVDGLSLFAAVNWNRGRYKSLKNVPCWAGQTVALGCDTVLNTVTGLYTAQDLSGAPLLRAPRVQANFGFDYEIPVGDYKLTLGSSSQYSSRFTTFLSKNYPGNAIYQGSFIRTDASLALGGSDDRWEVALIGKNITDKVTAGNCSPSNAQNGLIFGGQTTGGTTSGPAGFGEVSCFAERGRSVWLRITLRPNAGR
jgi:iron complex outermembrane receptor protein